MQVVQLTHRAGSEQAMTQCDYTHVHSTDASGKATAATTALGSDRLTKQLMHKDKTLLQRPDI